MTLFRNIFHLYRRAYTGLPRHAWTLFWVLLVNSSGMMVVFFLSLYLTRELSYSISDAGRTLSLFGFGSLVGSFLGGLLSDRLGSTNIQKLSLFLGGVCYIWLGHLESLWSINLMIFFLATASGMMFPANSTSMARLCPPEVTTKGFAVNRLANNIGASIGPAVGGMLALYSYSLLFWVDGLTCLAAVLLFSLLWKSPERHLEAVARTKPPGGRTPWKDTPFLLLMPLVLIWGTIFFQLFATFPLYMREVYGLAENRIGQLIIFNTLLIIIFEMLIVHWIGRRSVTRFITMSFFLTGLGFALMPLGRGFFYAAFTVMVWTLGEMLSVPLLGSFIALRAGSGMEGRYMGFFSFAFSFSMILGPLGGTFLYSRLGPNILWFTCGLLGVFLSLAFFALSRLLEDKKEMTNAS